MAKLKFGTDGWRALMAEEFTFAHVRFATQAIARYLKAHDLAHRGVVVGHDTRFLSDRFARAAVEVFAGAEIRSFLTEGDAPTPAVAAAVLDRQAAGALMVTASHNPPEWNGLKFVADYGGPASPEIIAEIEENMALSPPDEKIFTLPLHKAEDQGLVESVEPRAGYFARLRKLVDLDAIRRAGLSVVFDPRYGSGRGYADALLAEAGVRVKVLHNYRDPLFGGGAPDAAEATLRPLAQAVTSGGAVLGLATDGDGERFGIVDSLGQVISPNEFLAVLLVHLIKRRKMSGRVVRSVATTHLLDRIGKRHGVEVVEVPVGFKHIAKHMRKDDIILGAEESGGLSIRGHIPGRDGTLACLLAAEVAAIEGKPLSTVLREAMGETGELHSRRLTLDLPDEERRRRALETLRKDPPAYIAGIKVVDIYEIDGIKLILGDGSWLLVRPSGTEPVLRVHVEASSRDALRRLERFVEELAR